MNKLLLVIAVLGLAVSGYLLFAYQTTGPMVCLSEHGCEAVRASRFAVIFGLPVPLYGVLYYFGLGVLAALWNPAEARRLRLPLRAVTGAGVAGSMWLTYLEAFVIKAWCSWCVISAVLAVMAFLLVWGKLYATYSYGDNK